MNDRKTKTLTKLQLRQNRRILLFWGLLFIVIAGLLAALALRQMEMARASSSWPLAEGVIIESKRVRLESGYPGDTYMRWVASITYRYSVQGREYTDSRVTFAQETPSVHATKRLLAKYPLGKEVKVAYHPDQYYTSVLEPGMSLRGALMTIAGSGLIILFPLALGFLCFLGAWYWHAKLRQSHTRPAE